MFSLIYPLPATRIMYQHTGVGDIIGVELVDFEVVSRFRCGKLFAGDALYFAERAVGKKNFIAVL